MLSKPHTQHYILVSFVYMGKKRRSRGIGIWKIHGFLGRRVYDLVNCLEGMHALLEYGRWAHWMPSSFMTKVYHLVFFLLCFSFVDKLHN